MIATIEIVIEGHRASSIEIETWYEVDAAKLKLKRPQILDGRTWEIAVVIPSKGFKNREVFK